jgi:hypothetical protein
VVGTNSDPSDESIHGLSFIFFFCLPQVTLVTPGTLNSTPRQVSRVKSATLEGWNSRLSLPSASGGRHRGQNRKEFMEEIFESCQAVSIGCGETRH